MCINPQRTKAFSFGETNLPLSAVHLTINIAVATLFAEETRP